MGANFRLSLYQPGADARCAYVAHQESPHKAAVSQNEFSVSISPAPPVDLTPVRWIRIDMPDRY